MKKGSEERRASRRIGRARVRERDEEERRKSARGEASAQRTGPNPEPELPDLRFIRPLAACINKRCQRLT